MTRVRKPTKAFRLGDPVQDQVWPRMSTREIRYVGSRPDSAGTLIGWLVHRDYDSGYPQPYEVMRCGGTTYGFYATDLQALAGAGDYVNRYRQHYRALQDTGVLDFADVVNPDHVQADGVPRDPAAATDQEVAAAAAAFVDAWDSAPPKTPADWRAAHDRMKELRTAVERWRR